MLPARVYAHLPPKPTQEDIFATGISILFTDDTQNSHGLPGHSVIYTSPKFGDIKLHIPEHPDVEEGRKLFAHYLWNAGVVTADAIETASTPLDDDTGYIGLEDYKKVKWDRRYWNVRDRDILELGAGTALPSLISALSGARSITITDHPSSPALVTDTIAKNVLEVLKINLIPDTTNPTEIISADTPASTTTQSSTGSPPCSTKVSIHGLSWGVEGFTSATKYGKLSDPQPEPASFDKMIIADCLWMPSQHGNIVKTINTYLRSPQNSPSIFSTTTTQENVSVPCALVVAGFHTGRGIVARFFEIATGSRTAGKDAMREIAEQDDDDEQRIDGSLYAAEILEVDVDCNMREWLPDRPGECREQAKRWCVCAALVKR